MNDGLYVGETLDAQRERTGSAVHIDPSDLTTHGVVLGMTGSGKTGLGVVVLEEALRQGIPAIVLDPKGDLGNLLLTFPNLDAASFEPWVDPTDAESAGLAVSEYAARTATRWKNGLGGWGLGGPDIAALRQTCDLQLFTPGSTCYGCKAVLALETLDSKSKNCDGEQRARVRGTGIIGTGS